MKSLIKDRYTSHDLAALRRFFVKNNTLKIASLKNGLYPARAINKNSMVLGYSNVWVRDTVMVVNYLFELGQFQKARKAISTIRDYFFIHTERFINIIEGRSDKNNPMLRPHVRFNGETLCELPEKWAHAQNDALGYALWITFRLCNINEYKLTARDQKVWALFPSYFNAIEFWQDSDSGHWEEAREVKCSSIGVVTAALEEMKKYIINNPDVAFEFAGGRVTLNQLNFLIKKGKGQLRNMLPQETLNSRKADSALLFLIYPLAVVNQKQAGGILKSIKSDLEGEYGIRRYLGDSYWCADYKKLLQDDKQAIDYSDNIATRNKLLQAGQEAQWCIFDPIISVIYGQRFIATGKLNYHNLQTKYFNRSLSQLTSKGFEFAAGQCPELYYIEDSARGRYLPNDNTPLAWAQANLGVAFEYMNKSAVKMIKK